MSSLYNISNDILAIFNEIENNDGDITDKQYDALIIKQEELKTKLDAYVKAIKSWEVDEKALKDEKKKFNDRQNVFKNRIERLKKAALDAVLTFGEQGKSNMFIELPTCRLFSRSSKAVEVDEERTKILVDIFERYVRELVNAGILYTGGDVDMEGILDVINANAKAEQGDNFEPFTMMDLVGVKLTISQTQSIYDFLRNGHNALTMYGQEPIYTTIKEDTPKDDWKNLIESSEQSNCSTPTVAKVIINQSLQIK